MCHVSVVCVHLLIYVGVGGEWVHHSGSGWVSLCSLFLLIPDSSSADTDPEGHSHHDQDKVMKMKIMKVTIHYLYHRINMSPSHCRVNMWRQTTVTVSVNLVFPNKQTQICTLLVQWEEAAGSRRKQNTLHLLIFYLVSKFSSLFC